MKNERPKTDNHLLMGNVAHQMLQCYKGRWVLVYWLTYLILTCIISQQHIYRPAAPD